MTTVPVRLLFPSFLAACAYDLGPNALRKGEVDEAAMLAGVEVALDGSIGTVSVPFSTPAPDVPQADFEDELADAAALRVVSSQSGAAAMLMTGESIDDGPAAVGEFSWAVNDERDAAVFTFYNEMTGGMRLRAGDAYTAQFSIATNDYVKSIGAMAFEVSVVGE